MITCSNKPSARIGKATYLNVPTNNNNSDSGYFAYSNNRMPPLSPPPPSSSSLGCWSRWCHAASTASSELARTLSLGTDASRFAWQVTRNLFACQRTRLSPLIPPPKRLRELRRDLPTRRLLGAAFDVATIDLPRSRMTSKANSARNSNLIFIMDINSFSLVLKVSNVSLWIVKERC